MSEQIPMGMSHEEFEKLIEEYIERGTQQTDDLDADIFYDALADFVAAPREVTIELRETWHDGQLSLSPESPVPPDVQVYGNRIVAPGFTFVIRPEQAMVPPDSSPPHHPELGPISPLPSRYPML